MQIGGGWSMAKALYHMSHINLRPGLAVGDHCPDTIRIHAVTAGDGEAHISKSAHSRSPSPTIVNSVSLRSLCRPGVPLLLNFGSCS